MTIRDKLNQVHRKFAVAVVGSWVCTVIEFLLDLSGKTNNYFLKIIYYVPFVSFLVAVGIYSFHGIRCPKCGNFIGRTTGGLRGSYFHIPEAMKKCPSCGVDYDTEM